MSKIVEFKSRKEKFKEWIDDVTNINFNNNPNEVKHCLLIWDTNKEGNHARFNCDLETLKYFHSIIGDKIREWEFDDYLRKNIGNYIQYIED